MGKLKFEKLDYKMIIENTLTDYLSEKAKDGWMLYRIKFNQLIFEKKEPQYIKYQIEYGESVYGYDYEYEDFLDDLGYKVVCQYDHMFIYKNENMSAPDLHSDEDVRLEVLKKNSKKGLIAFPIVYIFCCLPIYSLISLFFAEPMTLGRLFEEIGPTVFIITLILILLGPLYIIIKKLIVRHIINQAAKHLEPDYRLYNSITKFESIFYYPFIGIYIIGFILLITKLFTNTPKTIIHLLTTILIYVLLYFSISLIKKYRINKRVLILLLIIIIPIISGLRVSLTENIPSSQTKPIPTISSYMNEYTSYDEGRALLLKHKKFINNPDKDQTVYEKEILKTCVNEFVAEEIFKSDIIHYENETRANPEAIDKILEETGSYTTGDIPFYSYKDAVKNLKAYRHTLVDECYYDSHFMIARKDNRILISYIQNEDNYIGNIINHYFK